MKILVFIEKHQLAILATLLVHFVVLLVFNWVQVTTFVMKEPSIVIDFSEQPEIPLPEPETEDDLTEVEQTSASGKSVGNKGKNTAVPRMLNQAEYNQIGDQVKSSSQDQVDQEIREKLKAIEQSVIDEQRAAGYGYTPEQAEEFIQSFEANDVKDLPKQEARSEGAFKGETNISYRLENRYDTYIYVPVYLCQYGGTVTVVIAVDRSGNVVKTKFDQASSSNTDPCLKEAALKAATRMRFNSSTNAPALQRGSVTFVFQAQ